MHPIKKIKKLIKGFGAAVIAPVALGVLLPTLLLMGIFDWLSEINHAQKQPEVISQILEVEDLSELVEIKESPDGSGYYLDFVEGIDKKLEEIIKQSNKNLSSGIHPLPNDTDFLKKIFQAELVTQYPDLGGNIPEGSTGFQGATTLRRVTPNKRLGDINDNPGRGLVSTEEEDVVYEPSDDTKEGVVKSWEKGQQLITIELATVYEQAESKLNPGKPTGKWDKKHKVTEDGITLAKEYETIKKGTSVTYAGNYHKAENPLTKEVVIYVEIEHKGENKYVRADAIKAKSTNNKETAKITAERKVTSRADSDTEYAGKSADEEYVVAIAAGHNNSDDTGARSPDGTLIEEQLTIRTAERVEQLLKKYKNITVVQTGSTSANPSGIGVGDRTTLARNASPDLCIQIHFDAGGGSGVQAIYKAGDDISAQLADFVSNGMANAMGLPNKGGGSDLERTAIGSLGIIENAATSGFPSIVTEGGFLDGEPDATLLRGDGTNKCAQGIVNGILEYLKADHTGYTSTVVDDNKTQTLIESKIRNMKYVTKEKFDELIKNNSEEALKVFTIDEDGKIKIATWSMGSDGKIQIKENVSKINLKTALKSYIMPYEYLLYWYMDTDERSFTDKLADAVLDTEIIVAVQDNITTTQVNTTVSQKTVSENGGSSGWSQVSSTSVTTENCTTQIEVTYADAWCVKYYKLNNTYSDKELDWKEGETEKIRNVKGKVDRTEMSSTTGETAVGGGTLTDIDENGNKVSYNYTTYQQTTTNTKRMAIKYQDGDAKQKGDESKFVKIYQDTKINFLLRDQYLFTIIENNERTANLLNVTKYLLWKASGIGYGVYEDYDFSEYNIKNFSSSTGGGIYGGTIQEKVWVAVINAGYSGECAAGILGNMAAESGFNPAAINASSGALGLCQWLDRAPNLRAYAEFKGKDWADVNIQIEYLLGELSPSGGADGFATHQFMNVNGHSRSTWENAATPEDAAVAFLWSWERPNASEAAASMHIRTSEARKYYDMFKDREMSSFGGGSADDIIRTAREVLQDMLDRNITYGPQTYGNIKQTATIDNQYVCATYVAVVLYKSGALTEDQINAYNYHFTGYKGLPDMLAAAGWVQVDPSEAQPGDVVINYEIHAMIYAGGNGIYDESCAQRNGSIEPWSGWSFYANSPITQVYHRP